MATAIVTLIAMGIMLSAALMLTGGSISSFSGVSGALQGMEQRVGDTVRTSMSGISATTTSSSTQLRIVLNNDGNTPLWHFNDWDLIVQYFDDSGNLKIQRLTYTDAGVPSSGEWVIDGIFLEEQTSTPEVFDPGILNPTEEAVILATLSPSVGVGSSNLVTVANRQGIAVSLNFSN